MCRGISASETILTGHDAMSLRQYSLVPPDHTCRWRRGQWRGDQEAKLPGAVVDPKQESSIGHDCEPAPCHYEWRIGHRDPQRRYGIAHRPAAIGYNFLQRPTRSTVTRPHS